MPVSHPQRFVAALLAGLLATSPFQLLAQAGDGSTDEELVEPSETQQEYNDRGVILTQDRKYKEAIALFRSSLSLGELNITYLNLGRAYFRLDRCLDAREAYDAVVRAPKVKVPTPQEIGEILARFEEEYAERCSATVEMTCEGDPMVRVDDEPARTCSSLSGWPVTPGEHTVVATYGAGDVEKTVTIEGGATQAVAFEEPEVVAEPEPEPAPKPAPAVDQGTPLYVWLTLGTGVALIGTAIAWDLAVTGPKLDELEETEEATTGSEIGDANDLRDEIDMDQTITLIAGGAGIALAVTGAILWLVSGDDEPETGVSAWVSESAAGVVVGGTF